MSYPKDPAYGQQPAGQHPPAYPSAPPPYSSVPHYPPQQYQYSTGIPMPAQPYPTAQPNMMYPPAPPQYQYTHVPPQQNPGYPVQQGFNYNAIPAAHATFDSGARFDGIASQNIPPPPPGCAPNAAQMATARGGPVVASQKKASWLTGGTGGGVSFW